MLRGFPMDFPTDRNLADISDQWMLGPALMPCPVSEYKSRYRSVYFPQCEGWYDFYTGRTYYGSADARNDQGGILFPERCLRMLKGILTCCGGRIAH